MISGIPLIVTSHQARSKLLMIRKRALVRSAYMNLNFNLAAKRTTASSKPVGLTFDAFVDQFKGNEQTSLASNYPPHKIDKRLM